MSTSSKKHKLRKQAVVVEIGNDWIKLVQFEGTGAGLAISKMYLEKFTELGSGVSRAIAAALKTHKFADIPVIACLSRQMVNIRMLELPSTDPAEIADMVDLQSGKQTPYSKEEILCDHRIIGSVRSGYTKVMLVIVQRSLLRQQYAILRDAGLRIERTSVSSEGLINWASRELRDGGAKILLDIDSVYSDFAVVSDGGVIFTRSIMVGARELLGEFDKCKDRFLKEVKRSLDIFEAESGGLKPERLVVSGARVQQVSEYLAGNLSLPVSAKDSLACVVKKPAEPDLAAGEYRELSLTALAGVALDPDRLVFNLIPDVAKMRRDLEIRARHFSSFVVLAMAAMVSASLFATTKFFLERSALHTLQADYQATLPTVQHVESMQEIIKVVRERTNRKFSPVNILAEIHRQVNGDLYFDVMDIDCEGGKVSLAGTAAASSEIRTLVTNLENSPMFENVREPGTRNLDPRTSRYKFEIVCSLEK
jgi:Tfp pilus assembly PilM family ATPase